MSQVYTAGYHGASVQDLQAWLSEHPGVVVCDIRISPKSRIAEWRGDAVKKALPANHYVWMREFGNVDYRGHGIELADPEAGLNRIRKGLEVGAGMLLLCVCGDYEKCHRSLVAKLITKELGVVPVEISLKGLATTAPGEASRQKELFA